MNIRLAGLADAAALADIYAPYVKNTAVTFEYTAPDAEEFARRMAAVSARYPFLAAEENGVPCGYAYASAFKSRPAYDWSVETSVYVRGDARGRGIGTALYETLERCLALQNVCNLCACIAYPNPGSVAFHEKQGYRTVAHFTKAGFKAGAWYDMIWMEKTLCLHTVPPGPFLPFGECKAATPFPLLAPSPDNRPA